MDHIEQFSFDRQTNAKLKRNEYFGGRFTDKPIQSVCYDTKRKRYYVGFNQSDPNLATICIMKNLDFLNSSVDRIVENLHLDHCNDMVYDSGKDRIFVAGGNQWIGVVEPETMAVEKQIPMDIQAWSIARYNDGSGDFYVHNGDTGRRYKADFSEYRTLTTGDYQKVMEWFHVPYHEERGAYRGVWQGAVIMRGVPYMIFNELDYETGSPKSCILISRDAQEPRYIFRTYVNNEVESACIVDGRMRFVYGNHRIGGYDWYMSEPTMKMFSNEYGPYDILAGKTMSVDLAEYIPDEFELVSANVQFMPSQTQSLRNLPYHDSNGKCIIKVLKVKGSKVYIHSKKDYEKTILYITGFCKKKD